MSLVAAAQVAAMVPAHAVTTNNGSLVYSPAAGTSFNPEGGRAAGTTYSKIINLKSSGTANGQLIVTYDQLVLENGVQIYPIYRSTDDGVTWSRIAAVSPLNDFVGYNRTAQPSLFELRQAVGNLPAGTILLSGMVMPQDRSASKIVIYRSLDHGVTWSLLSQVDQGGPATYDPSPTSTTTTIWEPSLALDPSGNILCFFSDEREKASGVLQAVVYRRSTDGGLTWGPVVNVAAINNQSDRPGMITVTKLPNGSYLASYEVVNRPSQTNNLAQVYSKISADGLNWTPGSLGTAVALRDGRGLGSSPFVVWVPSGGPNGMVVIASKWALTPAAAIDGGQDFLVNYNLGQGPWERLPHAVTYDSADVNGSFSGFAQGLDVSADGKTLYQATNVENLVTTYNDVRVGTIPLNSYQYEAERASTNHISIVNHGDASNGQKVGNINFADSWVQFSVNVPTAGTYTVNTRYDNGTGANSTQTLSVNGATGVTLTYPPTRDWARFLWVQNNVTLSAGANTLRYTFKNSYAELDQIQVYQAGVAINDELRIINRSSAKYLEITSAALTDGSPAGQWTFVNNPTQIWRAQARTGGYYSFINKNSGKLLEIPASSLTDGAGATQLGANGTLTQEWRIPPTNSGYFQIVNHNSSKLLELYGNSQLNGAFDPATNHPLVDQWGPTTCTCQEWTMSKEGEQ